MSNDEYVVRRVTSPSDVDVELESNAEDEVEVIFQPPVGMTEKADPVPLIMIPEARLLEKTVEVGIISVRVS